MRYSPALMGGASLAVLTLAVVSTYAVMNQHFEDISLPGATSKRLDQVTAKLEEKRQVNENDAATSKPDPAPPFEIPKTEARPAKRIAAVPQQSAPISPPPTARRKELYDSARGLQNQLGNYGQAVTRAIQGPVDKPVSGDYRDQGRDRFTSFETNPVKVTAEAPVSTFSIDVDTASYAFVRSALNANHLPQKSAVRVEELINYFPYDYKGPEDRSKPFRSNVTVMPSPWNSSNKLLHVGIKGFDLKADERPRANLVFLLDTSGSMNAANKLPLLQKAMKLLLNKLDGDDTVSIVTYAGRAGTVLEPTRASDRSKILAALNNLNAGGSTAGGEGIRQAYRLAQQSFDKEAVNRVILATDGDFNVGIRNPEELKSFVERKRKSGIYLSVLGFGRGNYNDHLMQTLAQNGNGNASYIDTLNEARKVLGEEVGGTLFTIAKDVKIQVEFNPAAVSEYRLIGYETRQLKREDFNNDKVDAGDIGSGHTVTAIYEFTPKNASTRIVDDLRYAKSKDNRTQDSKAVDQNEYAFLKIRYKLPKADKSKLLTTPVTRAQEVGSVDAAPLEIRFATSVAAFGQLLRGGRYTGSFTYDDVVTLAQGSKGQDPFGYRAEFVNLARFAKSAAALQSAQ